MQEFPSSVRSVRFGVFEVDLRAGELRKKGTKIRLQGQPYMLLVTLLKEHGEVVTREELRRVLWPEDTFVDFDHSLGTAMNKLRGKYWEIQPPILASSRHCIGKGIDLSLQWWPSTKVRTRPLSGKILLRYRILQRKIPVRLENSSAGPS